MSDIIYQISDIVIRYQITISDIVISDIPSDITPVARTTATLFATSVTTMSENRVSMMLN